METFRGKVENTRDALIIFGKACRLGILQRITRRCLEEEKKEFVPGSVKWSPSRIYGDFLLYQELEYRLHNVKCYEDIDESIKKRIETEQLKYNVCNKGTFIYSKEGFNKKTISVTVDGSLQHMIIYEDKKGNHDDLHPPWAYVELANIEPSKSIIKQLGLRKRQQQQYQLKDIKLESNNDSNFKCENNVNMNNVNNNTNVNVMNNVNTVNIEKREFQTLSLNNLPSSIVNPFSPVTTTTTSHTTTPQTEISDPMKITNVINTNAINWLGRGGGRGNCQEKDEKVIEKGNSTTDGQHYGIINGFHHNPWQNSFSHLRSCVPSYYQSMIVREPLIPYHVPVSTQISTHIDSSVTLLYSKPKYNYYSTFPLPKYDNLSNFGRFKSLLNLEELSNNNALTLAKIKRIICQVGLGILGITTATTIMVVTWSEPYRDKFTNADYKSEEYIAAQKVVHLRVAKRLLSLCRLHTGIYIKGAQHLASLTFIVPREYTETLSILQDRAPYRSMNDVNKIFREEFDGLLPKDIYAEFEEIPMAAASLAQVHIDDKSVVVKVQYPDVSRLFHVDVWTMQSMSNLVSYFFPEFELTWIITEFKQNLISEFDFLREAKNGELTKQRFKHRGDELTVPNIIWDLTTKRVLTMEYIKGVKINDLVGLKSLGANPKWVRNLLLEVFAEMIFCHGIVHCDPHPGNALVTISPVTKKPQLVLLDHGLYRELSNDFRKTYCDLWKALILNDTKLLKETVDKLGVPQYIQFLPLIFTQRIPDSSTPLGEDMSIEEKELVHDQLKNIKLNDFFDFLESLPRDMLLVFRTINLVRGIHKELGGKSMERPLQRWYLLGGTPNLKRTLGYIQDKILMTIRLYFAELSIRILRWWYLLSRPIESPVTLITAA
ncbi:9549_t:CDS:10 [Diversispora eburnea]|uniref:9549_t:CDS:1 n=1 Tax=Diversispora eburnea TaxID=1213867 RepID=A0A9N8YI19_9GLOM|nr:9549_t:CDS:10 [Diversispora eburnea]